MVCRATGLVMLAAQAAWGDEPKWVYARLVDRPLAPVERTAAPRIIKVSADAKATAVGQNDKQVVKASHEKTAKVDGEIELKSASQPWRVFVGGEVVRAGAFNAQRPLTALQSAIAAGGLKETGNASEIVVLTYYEINKPPKAKRIDLSKSLAGKGTDDVWLESHDVVIVPKKGSFATTEGIVEELPKSIADAAKSRLVEKQRMQADADKAMEKELPLLPVK